MAKRLTGWRRCAFALCTVAAMVAGTATAADRLMTFTEDCEYLMRTSASEAATTTNSANTYITVSGNVTITFLKTDNEDTARRSYSHWLIDGNVTFDFSQWSGSLSFTPWFQNSIIIRDGASLTLKCANETSYPNGMNAIYFGNINANPETGGSVSTYSLGGLLLDGVNALSIQHSVELLALPADATARAAIVYQGGSNANGLIFAGNGTAARFLDEDGDLAVTNVTTSKQDVYIYERTALPDGAGLKIAAGRNVILLPVYHSTNSFGAASLNVNRVMNKKEALDWDVITVKEMGPGATIKTYRSTHVAFADGVSAWGSTVNGVTTWTGGTAGEALDASGGTSANVNAKIVTKGDFAPVFYGVSSTTPPIVTEGDATIDLFSAAAAPTIYANGGTATISRVDGAAFGGLEPKLWLDASVTASISGIGARTNDSVALASRYAAQGEMPLYRNSADDGTGSYDLVVEQWGDRRSANGTPFGSDIVAYMDGAYSATSFTKQIYPYLVASGDDCPNGMPYVCFGSKAEVWGALFDATNKRVSQAGTTLSNARLPFCSGGKNTVQKPSTSNLTGVNTVVMVFGSQNGGGIAPIGVSGEVFKRVSSGKAEDVTAETPVTSQSARPMWLNGTQVVANETKFSGGWDVLTICTTNLTLQKLSAGSTATAYSGQNYAEVIFFEEELTDAQRVNVERYLAAKWGLAAKYGFESVASAKLMSAGTNGTVKVQTDLALSGSFAGTLELDGVRVAITDQTKPGTAADVPTDGCLGWFDADADGFFTFTPATHTYPNALQWVYNILEGTPTTSSVIPWGGGSRSPLRVASARGLGVERTWFDFNGSPSTGLGNTIRFCEYSTKAQPTESPLENVRTVIMAQDSCRGGGQPFQTVAIKGYPRRTTPDWTDAIWRVNSLVPTAYTNASVRLDGATVDACSDGFGGCPEVLTVQAAAGEENNLTVGAFGYYGNSDYEVTGSSKKRHGEVIGEILLYSRDLSDAERAKVETYLMDKWVNRLPAGYGDLSQATLTGTGSLSAAKWSQVPKIASTFSGTVSAATVDEMKISIEADGTVTGGLVCPDATLALPAAVTATITVAAGAPEGLYPIIDCDSGDTVWTFSVITPGSRTASVKQIDGAYALAVAKLGTMILVR